MALEAVRGGSLFLLVQGGRLRRRSTPALGSHGLSAAIFFLALSVSVAASGHLHGWSTRFARANFSSALNTRLCLGWTAISCALGTHVCSARQVRFSVGAIPYTCGAWCGMAIYGASRLAT